MNPEEFKGFIDTGIGTNAFFHNMATHKSTSINLDDNVYTNLIKQYEKEISRYREIILRRCPEELI